MTSNIFKNKLALVVDDDSTARLVAQKNLEKLGFAVTQASDGDDALEMLKAMKPDVILLDVEMERVDGYTTCQFIREDPVQYLCPVIMLTAHGEADSVDKAFLAGATDFATKPVNWSLLRHKIQYVMRGVELLTELSIAEKISKMGSYRTLFSDDVTTWSIGLQHVLGESETDIVNLIDPDDLPRVSQELKLVRTGKSMNLIHRMLLPDASSIIVQHNAEPIVSHVGEVVGLMGTIQDVTAREEATNRIHLLAYMDPVTTLPNRAAFLELLDRAVTSARKLHWKVAVLYLDVDDFQRINDSLGHNIGDQLLKAVGKRIIKEFEIVSSHSLLNLSRTVESAELQEGNYAARLGGDEFGIIILANPDRFDPETFATDIVKSINKTFELNQRSLTITPSVGYSIYPQHGEEAQVLLKNADTAMSAAKKQGKNTVREYDTALSEVAQRRLLIENHLRRAMENNELSLAYQPQVRVDGCEVVGVEALIRWYSPELGQITPFEFIPLAEEMELIVPIGAWVLKTACNQLVNWQAKGYNIGRMAVNISVRQFSQDDFVQVVQDTLLESGVKGTSVELEITESILAHDIKQTIEKLKQLKALGIELSVDDFGTGYSSLSYLKQFPIDRLKIDQSFVRDLDTSAEDLAITTTIIGLARGLSLGVIAEGVETAAHLEKLTALDCDEAQGYLFTKPLPAAELEEWLNEYEKLLVSEQLKSA